MPETTHQVDHKAEALRLIEESDLFQRKDIFDATDRYMRKALVHSNLAIAEGQERVAEAIGDALGDGSNLDHIVQALRAIAEPVKYGIDPRSLS